VHWHTRSAPWPPVQGRAYSSLGPTGSPVRELTGTAVQPLVTGGIYRHSRKPQYASYILTLSGLVIAAEAPQDWP
jgi:hypothetical protein